MFSIGSTPLLLAASSGALSALRCLLSLGAYILRVDEEGNNLIHLAALRFHTNILEYFIQWNHPDIDVWQILVGESFLKQYCRQYQVLLDAVWEKVLTISSIFVKFLYRDFVI